MGHFGYRDDGRPYIQWVDGAGRQKQETQPTKGKNGKPLTAKGIELEGNTLAAASLRSTQRWT